LRPVTTVIDVRRGDFRVVQSLLDTFVRGLREGDGYTVMSMWR
jgi:hypothetical protein